MPRFSTASLSQLGTCDARLQRLMMAAIELYDFTVLEGHRGQEAQDRAYAKGNSKVRWPNGNHNATPSRAVDVAPYPIDWSNKSTAIARFTFLSGIVYTLAHQMGIKVRLGWDWNRNLDPRDERFLDWGHVELDEP